MALYLVQHGRQIPKEEDPEQHLSEEGRAEVHRVAELAREHGVKVDRIEHSPKERARETAEIFAQALKPENGISEREGIKALDDVVPVARELESRDGVMLVGHLPFMQRLVSYLVAGDQEKTVIKFQNAGIVCLDRDSQERYVKWTLLPHIE
jgi:phosphohistidine phosphatase